MNDTTRRGFLGLLAHLPLVGAWLAGFKKRTESPSEWPDEIEVDGKYYRHFDREMCRIIRWIPVTESVPELDRIAYHDGRYGFSRNVLMLCRNVRHIGSEDGESRYGSPRDAVGLGHRWREGRSGKIHWVAHADDNATIYRDVTHWAELPAPPEE